MCDVSVSLYDDQFGLNEQFKVCILSDVETMPDKENGFLQSECGKIAFDNFV